MGGAGAGGVDECPDFMNNLKQFFRDKIKSKADDDDGGWLFEGGRRTRVIK